MQRKTVLRHKDIIIAASLAALNIAAVVLVQLMVIIPAKTVAANQEKKVVDAVKQLEESSKKRRQLEQLDAENAEMRSKLAVFDKRIPLKAGIPALFAEVLRAADRNGLKILQTQPKPPSAMGQGFHRFPYELELQGDYHAIGHFVTGIESHDSFMQVVKADLSALKDSSGTVKVKVLLHLYGSVETSAQENTDAGEDDAPAKS